VPTHFAAAGAATSLAAFDATYFLLGDILTKQKRPKQILAIRRSLFEYYFL